MVAAALEDAVGPACLALCLDAACSHVLQALLREAAPPSLAAFARVFGCRPPQPPPPVPASLRLLLSPFGSHVAETLFDALAAAGPSCFGEAEGVSPKPLKRLVATLAPRAHQLAAHRAASPALRAFLGVLSGTRAGRPVVGPKRGDGGGDDAALDAPTARRAHPSHPPGCVPYPALLDSFVSGCVESISADGGLGPGGGSTSMDPAGSAFLQALVAARAAGGDEAATSQLVCTLLGMEGGGEGEGDDDDADGNADAAIAAPSASNAELYDAAIHPTSSRLLEACIAAAPAGARFAIGRALAPRAAALASHPVGNHVLQALLKSLRRDVASDGRLAEGVSAALVPTVAALLLSGNGTRAGVVVSLATAAAATGAANAEVSRCVARALAAAASTAVADAPPPPPAAPAPAPAATSYLSVLAPWLLRRVPGPVTRPGGFSLHGCAILSALLRLPSPSASRPFADSLAAVAPAEAIAACRDASASRCVEALLRSPGVARGLKRKLASSLSTDWAAVAASPPGAHVLAAALDVCSVAEQEALVAALAAGARAVRAAPHGRALLARLGVDLYARDVGAWRMRHATADKNLGEIAMLAQGETGAEQPENKKGKKKHKKDVAALNGGGEDPVFRMLAAT